MVLECNGQAITSLEALEVLVRPTSKKPVLLKVRQGKLIHFALVERKGAAAAP